MHLTYALIEETKNFSSDMLPPRLLVIHNTRRGCENDVTELTRWQELHNPLLQVCQTNVVTGRDDTSLVEAVKQSVSS